MMDPDVLETELANKAYMEMVKYENIDIVHDNVEAAKFASTLDNLVVRNVPGHFPGFTLKHAGVFGGLSAESILSSLLDHRVEVAVTPLGNADAPVDNMYFAQPYLIHETVRDLVEQLTDPARAAHYYFQSQNDNLDQLTVWGCPVPRTFPKELTTGASFFGEQQAANLWIGTKGTTSRLHNDNYDNLFIQVAGTKRVYLIPPGFAHHTNEKYLKPAFYKSNMELEVNAEAEPVVFPTLDPSTAELSAPFVPTWVVDLEPGDLLFIPALWYHQVEITSDDVNVSLNYWHAAFDDEKRWAEWNFTRQMALMMHNFRNDN